MKPPTKSSFVLATACVSSPSGIRRDGAISSVPRQSCLPVVHEPTTAKQLSHKNVIPSAELASDSIPRGGGEDTDLPKNGSDSHKAGKSSKNTSKKKKKRSRKKEESSLPNQEEQPNNSEPSKEPPKPSRSNRIVEDILAREDFYEILGVKKDSTETQIKKAYRKKAVQTHPDKTGGDRRAFDKVAEAYEVLTDPSKKQLYDRFGKEGLESGGGMGGGGMQSGGYPDLFRNLFRQQQQAQARKNRTMRYQLQVSLKDLYHGLTQNVVVSPPMGRRGDTRSKEVQVHIPRGSLSGQSIVMSGEMDFNDDDIPGDLVFILSQAPDSVYTRKGHDLAMELTLSLEEAVCGFRRPIVHLNGEDVWIKSASNSNSDLPLSIQTGDIQVLKGKGMPKKNQGEDDFGDLYVQFRVEMPSSSGRTPLSATELQDLQRLLRKLQGSPSKGKEPNGKTKVLPLQVAKRSDFGRASGPVHIEEEDQFGQDDQQHQSFASNFFQGASGASGSSFYYGRNFGPGYAFGAGESYGDDDDGNVQCQQM